MSDSKDKMKAIWQEMSAEERKEMMESFFSEMKGEEGHQFWNDMMENGNGKKDFNPMKMMGMMHKMISGKRHLKKGHRMSKMMGGRLKEKGINPMEMMSKMMGGDEKEEGINPMEMCAKMMGDDKGSGMMEMCGRWMSKMQEGQKISTLATPEVRALFEDWAEQIEDEILESINDKNNVDVKSVAEEFKISKDSAYYFLTRLAQKEKVKLKIDREEPEQSES